MSANFLWYCSFVLFFCDSVHTKGWQCKIFIGSIFIGRERTNEYSHNKKRDGTKDNNVLKVLCYYKVLMNESVDVWSLNT